MQLATSETEIMYQLSSKRLEDNWHSDLVSSTPRISLYKILFHLKALLWESFILALPSPHLQRLPYCNTIGRPLRNIRPATDPPCLCHAPYNIGHGNLV